MKPVVFPKLSVAGKNKVKVSFLYMFVIVLFMSKVEILWHFQKTCLCIWMCGSQSLRSWVKMFTSLVIDMWRISLMRMAAGFQAKAQEHHMSTIIVCTDRCKSMCAVFPIEKMSNSSAVSVKDLISFWILNKMVSSSKW